MPSTNNPSVFFSYARADDDVENGRLSQIRVRLERELRFISGDPWEVFQDTEDIDLGQRWRRRLAEGLTTSTYFVPIITPTYLKRPMCREELSDFLGHEQELGRDDLVFPILYLATPILAKSANDPLVETLRARQMDDWRPLRIHSLDTAKVKQRITRLAESIMAASHRAVSEFAHHSSGEGKRFSEVTLFSTKFDLGLHATKRDFFAELRPVLKEVLGANADDAVAALEEREIIVPTGAAGLACPHAYRTYVDRYYVGLIELSDALDWDSADGKLVHTIFLYIGGGSSRSGQALAVMGRAHNALLKVLSQTEDPTALRQMVETVTSSLSADGLTVALLSIR